MTKEMDDYLRGMRDCQEGIEHQSGQTKDYDRGYGYQYIQEQNLAVLSERRA